MNDFEKQQTAVQEVEKELAKYAGAEKVHDTMILMHNRKGIRIEYNLSTQELELWFSPKAGQSTYYRDRNFSNRDDHMKVFDKISFANLALSNFKHCEYDPFYSVVHFENQKVHLFSPEDRAVVMIWFEQNQIMDFKADKADSMLMRNEQILYAAHPERGYNFCFAAVAGKGEGKWIHQTAIDTGRSVYARIELARDQLLILGAGLEEENVIAFVSEYVENDRMEVIQKNAASVEKACGSGRIAFRGMAQLEELLHINKKIIYSMQDASGSIRASIKRIYYLIWVREGGIAWPFSAYSGWVEPMEKWNEFLLDNPLEISEPGLEGKTFGQLVNRKISKWQEDGPFYAIWSAFTHWTQTGSDKFVTGEYLKLLKETVAWLENYCYSNEEGLFGRYFYCETAFEGSHDFCCDNAVGKPITQYAPKAEGQVVVRSYDSYINSLMYSSYIMLAAMEKENAAQDYLQKANALNEKMRYMFKDQELPLYGTLLTKEGNKLKSPAYGMDLTDYVWGLSLAPFSADYFTMNKIRNILFDNMVKAPKGYFVACSCSLLTSLDTEFVSESSIIEAVEYIAKQCYKPGKYLPMPNTVVEMVDVEEGNIYHDIRPQAFSIGTFIGAAGNIAVRRMPFGIAFRASSYVRKVSQYAWKGCYIDVFYEGLGKIGSIILNGKELKHTWQLAEEALEGSEINQVVIQQSQEEREEPVLIYSTVRLENVSVEGGEILYSIEAFGKNELVFKRLGKDIAIIDSNGRPIEFQRKEEGSYTGILFDGKGMVQVKTRK